MPDVTMPRLSDSMEEGTIVAWHKTTGDEVAVGDELADIETDKATMTYEAEDAGTLQIVVDAGETVPVGALIATIGNAPAVSAPPRAAGSRPKASPVARRMSRELGIALEEVLGTGPGGRIVKADILAAANDGATRTAVAELAPPDPPAPELPAEHEAAVAGPAVAPADGVSALALSSTQKVIARRMTESKATIPDFTVSMEIDMEPAVAFRARVKEEAADSSAVVPSFNDLVVKACALALVEHPRANGSYREGAFHLHEHVNVGVAVAAENALVVPVVRNADTLSLGAIARRTRSLAAAVRDGTIAADDLAGGTFTVSNLGMYGVSSFAAIVNPPQAAILAVGELQPRPVVRERRVVVRHMLTATLTSDHRILYGADAARFLARVRELLERPMLLGVS